MLSKSKLPKEKKDKLIENFKVKIKGCKMSSSSVVVAEGATDNDDGNVISSICDIESPHSQYPSAHRSYEVRYEPHRGRFVVASEVSTAYVQSLFDLFMEAINLQPLRRSDVICTYSFTKG